MEAVVVLLVSDTGVSEPSFKASHCLSLYPLFVAFIVWLASFAAAISAAAWVANIVPDELGAAQAVTAVRHAIFVKAHRDTAIGNWAC
jgi:hypothetical protein